VRAGFVANTRINRLDFGVSWNDVVERGGFVVGKTIDITFGAEAILDGPDDGAREHPTVIIRWSTGGSTSTSTESLPIY
jgi:hypothetical protein